MSEVELHWHMDGNDHVFTANEIARQFVETFDETHDVVQFAGLTFDASYVARRCDVVAWRVMLADEFSAFEECRSRHCFRCEAAIPRGGGVEVYRQWLADSADATLIPVEHLTLCVACGAYGDCVLTDDEVQERA